MRATFRRMVLVVLLTVDMVLSPAMAAISANIPGFYGGVGNLVAPSANSLPQIQNIVQGISGLELVGSNRLIVHQNEDKAIVDWRSFDIGANAWTHFDQQGNTNWSALNRIYDRNPSQIFGRLTADGSVYLINQNGFLFSPNATVNTHALAASAHNLIDDDFLNGRLRFEKQNYLGSEDFNDLTAVVANHGEIATDEYGTVLLIGDTVENSGRITAPLGRIILCAKNQVEIENTEQGTLDIVTSDSATHENRVWNLSTGEIVADSGYVGLFGKVVNQDGLVRSVTAIKKGGQIVLKGTDLVSTGKDSLTETPVSESLETAHESFDISKGSITIEGGRVLHQGMISSPSGRVFVAAEDRILLEDGSHINVSGEWVSKSAADSVLTAQLNSVELRDDYIQKNDTLQGENINFEYTKGSSIGDVSDHLSTEKTAKERSVQAGEVVLQITNDEGDVILKNGAVVDISGGGIDYAGGVVNTTRLIAGRSVFDISEAPNTLHYDGVLNYQVEASERFGIKQTYEGIYYGGANSLMNVSGGYREGADAGSLIVESPMVVLEGTLLATAEQGLYQTEQENADGTTGTTIPKSGTLQFGKDDVDSLDSFSGRDFVFNDLTIDNQGTSLPADFDLESDLDSAASTISAAKLNSYDLSEFVIFSNGYVDIKPEVQLVMEDGGRLDFRARAINHQGKIVNHGGKVELRLEDNSVAPSIQEIQPRIVLASGSVIDVSGNVVNNFGAGSDDTSRIASEITSGGSICLYDYSDFGQGVIVNPGAVLDVSGGLTIDTDGGVGGDDAGTLEAVGKTVIMQATIRGHALEGYQGGTLLLHAENVSVTASSQTMPTLGMFDLIPDDLQNHLSISGSQLAAGGFQTITLKSVNDLDVVSGAVLRPSVEAFDTNLAADILTGNRQNAEPSTLKQELIVELDQDHMGITALNLAAGIVLPSREMAGQANQQATLTLESQSAVKAGIQGSVSLTAPAVTVQGEVSAPAGSIAIIAENASIDLLNGAVLDVKGYNRVIDTDLNRIPEPIFEPLAGGSISLDATSGSVNIGGGVLLDVSGAERTKYPISHFNQAYTDYDQASRAGDIEITYRDELAIEGAIRADVAMDNLYGGSVSLLRSDLSSGLDVDQTFLNNWSDAGFDAIHLASYKAITFTPDVQHQTTEPLVFEAGRQFTLDAPKISASDGLDVRIEAPWIKVQNTYSILSDTIPSATGGGVLTLQAGSGEYPGFMDISGRVVLDGFSRIALNTSGDLRLSDRTYTKSGDSVWAGSLQTNAETLSFEAARIYPSTLSDFSIVSDNRITITSADSQGSASGIASAGGHLSIEANQIDVNGIIAAPLGTIDLSTTGENGSIHIGEGGRLTTAGQELVLLGELDEDYLTMTNKQTGEAVDITAAPAKSISVTADNIQMDAGSQIDLSSGGGIFAYQFLPGTEGSTNPLDQAQGVVVVPVSQTSLPGDRIYIQGGNGIEEGVYAVVPDSYAFSATGALYLTPAGKALHSDQSVSMADGARIALGYSYDGASRRSEDIAYQSYFVRSAADVLKQGYFNYQQHLAQEAGALNVTANDSAVIGATILAHSSDASPGADLAFIGANVIVYDQGHTPAQFDAGHMYIASDGIESDDIAQLTFGSVAKTQSVVIQSGVELTADKIDLAASGEIVLLPEAVVWAKGETGTAAIESPDGRFVLNEGATLRASKMISFETDELDLSGDLIVDSSAIAFAGNIINLLEETPIAKQPGALYLTRELLSGFSEFEEVLLAADTNLILHEDFAADSPFQIGQTLILDTPLISGVGFSDIQTMTIHSEEVIIRNSNDSTAGPTLGSTGGEFQVTADILRLGGGNVSFDGFNVVHLIGDHHISLEGQGVIGQEGILKVETAGLILNGRYDKSGAYQAPNYTLNATGSLELLSNHTNVDVYGTEAAKLALNAENVTIDCPIDLPAGSLTVSANGSEQTGFIRINDQAVISLVGNEHLAGGSLLFDVPYGSLIIDPDARIDLSAGDQGDAGALTINAPHHVLEQLPDITAQAGPGGTGGKIALDVSEIASLGALINQMAAGGFDDTLAICTRNGDLVLDTAMQATHIHVSADGGNLRLSGSLSGNGAGAETIELYAANDLFLEEGSLISVKGGDEGIADVFMSSSHGSVNFNQGARIESENGAAREGKIYIRTPFENERLNVSLEGTIVNSSLSLEGFQVFNEADHDNVIDTEITDVFAQAVENMHIQLNREDNKADLLSQVTYIDQTENGAPYQLSTAEKLERTTMQTGIEIQSSSDLTIKSNWRMSDWAYQPGALVIRSAGDLIIDANIIDAPSGYYHSLNDSSALSSCRIDMVAGADLNRADPMALLSGNQELRIADDRLVYTERAAIRFASAGNTYIGSGISQRYMVNSSMVYNLGTYKGEISGRVMGNLTIDGGAIQSAVGDITIDIGNDLILDNQNGYVGTIRTTGRPPADASSAQYWQYAEGGDIFLNVNGNIEGLFSGHRAWDWDYADGSSVAWGPSYGHLSGAFPTEGIVTMAGGDISVTTGGDVFTQIGCFGKGDLTLRVGAGLDARLLVKEGDGHVFAAGSIGTKKDGIPIEMFDADVSLISHGDIHLASILNPSVARDGFTTDSWKLGYTEQSRINLSSIEGNVILTGDVASLFYSNFDTNAHAKQAGRILPGTVELFAAKDIRILDTFFMAPSSIGNLKMVAGGDIDGGHTAQVGKRTVYEQGQIFMSDMDPLIAYTNPDGLVLYELLDLIDNRAVHDEDILHLGDANPIEISAGGNIEAIALNLPKMAILRAGNDIVDLFYYGQNVSENDLTVIEAGRDIYFSSLVELYPGSFLAGFEHGGPGSLVIAAKNSIDLGKTSGIRTTGNIINPALPVDGSDLMVIAGYELDADFSAIRDFFHLGREYGETYSRLLAEGDVDGAASIKAEMREKVIAPLMEGRQTGDGTINMINSQISSNSGFADLFILSSGQINVGRSTFVEAGETVKNTGVYTSGGGGINIYSELDVNVNESRIMTFKGGDITVISNSGNINAGRGSKTAVSAEPPKRIYDPTSSSFVLKFEPPAVGSGIRAVTFDPDGFEGPMKAPDIGDIYLFALDGKIDAGEAGIAGKNIVLAATEVINAQNIEVAGTSVGVPDTSASAASLGALAGSGVVSETSKIAEEQAALGGAKERFSKYVADLTESLVPKWLAVEVIGFGEPDGSAEGESSE